MEPTVARFRALARSSPWRWSTLRYVQQQDPSGREQGPVRVFVLRPKLARVESLDGTLLRVLREEPQTSTPLSRDGDARPVELPEVADAVVDLDADGLARRRPDRWEYDTETAMIVNYYDVALLDPLELADGHDGGPGTTIDELRLVDHRGREAWEAIPRPTAVDDPRCPCCSLLLSELIEEAGFDLCTEDPGFAYPDAHRVRLEGHRRLCLQRATRRDPRRHRSRHHDRGGRRTDGRRAVPTRRALSMVEAPAPVLTADCGAMPVGATRRPTPSP